MTKFIDIKPTKKELITYGLAASLLLNVTFGVRNSLDKNEYKETIKNLTSEVESSENDKQFLAIEIGKRIKKDRELQEKVDSLANENFVIKSKLNETKVENDKLKKALERKEVNKKTYYEITAFTAGYESTQKRKGESRYGITASGATVQEGVTISCPPSLPFGTKVNIEGIGTRICQDRGNAITEGHIDLYMNSLNKAINFGRQKLLVEILN